MTRPDLLIEQWFPTNELGIESVRERAAASALPPISFLHVWWARRPLAASAGAILTSMLPAWAPDLVERFGQHQELATEDAYQRWVLRLCGVLGDPVEAERLKLAAAASGVRLASNPFTYRQSFKNSPTTGDLRLLHEVLVATWGGMPLILDPTAGGGSIPYTAIRYGLPAYANDLNPVAAAVLRAGVELPARFGADLVPDIRQWGKLLCERIADRTLEFFPDGPEGKVTNYIWVRSVPCPRTGKPVPLAPNWWLSKGKGGVAARVVVTRHGVELDEPEFDVVAGGGIDRRATDAGTITRGVAVSPWDHLTIDGEYIKSEARAGRMGSILYGVVVQSAAGRLFRAPTAADRDALVAAEAELARLLPKWEREDVIPDEAFPDGNDMRPAAYGMPRWRDMFSPRQLLVHGTFVEEYRRLIPEVRTAISDRDQADAVLALLAMMQGKALNWNAILSSWTVSTERMRSVFDRHDFAFKWTYAEFEGARDLYPWTLKQAVGAFSGLVDLLSPGDAGRLTAGPLTYPVPGPVTVTKGNAANMPGVADASVELVCIDPPYYDNVMYAELADFFYVWEKRTLGQLWPEFFADELTNKDEEAVANPSRFAHAGRRKQELATLDYERKMTAIFAESRRVLKDRGVMTVMFTHKKAGAWDTLGQSLLEAGFTIEASWPIKTERKQALNQARMNAAASTMLLVCRKRPERASSRKVFFEAIESEVRHAARQAYARYTDAGFEGVDLLLATYGPTLSVLASQWPVYSSEPGPDGQSRLLRPGEALQVAQEETVRLHRSRLVARQVEFDPITDFWLLAWDTFKARTFPFDEARKLALAVGGIDIDDVKRAKVLAQKAGSVVLQEPGKRFRRGEDPDAPGVNRERMRFSALVDALHTAMYIVDMDGSAAVQAWLEQRQLTADERFRAVVEAAVAAVPRVKQKGDFMVTEASLLERLVVAAFPDIELPTDEVWEQVAPLIES